MSSVERLRARVAELSNAIRLQKEVLKNLEKDKSSAQRELNALLDPMARIPLEISSEIFLQSLPCFPERKPNVENAPVLLLRICHAWRNVALLTPQLWSGIQLIFPRTPGFNEGVQTWLHRASNRPLSISLCGPGTFDPGATAIVWRHAQQLEHLDLCYHKDEESDDDVDEDEATEVDLLGGIPGPMPSLKTLAIRGSTPLDDDQVYSGPQIRELLRLATNLVKCTFQRVSDVWSFEGELLVLPALRRLALEEESDDEILKFLSLPGLEAISMSLWGASINNLLLLLKRSAPPLRELDITVDGNAVQFIELQQCLRLLPILENFELWRPDAPLLAQVLAALAELPLLLLPRLHSLTIHLYPTRSLDFPACWEVLLQVISSRRAHIRRVHIELLRDVHNRDVRAKPADDITSAFRDRTRDGMQLYIGLEGGKSNLIF